MESATDKPQRHTMNMVRGRISIPGARYFVTLCENHFRAGFTAPETGSRLIHALSVVFAPNDARLLCATIMPNHLHLLFTLGSRLPLNRLISKFKAISRKTLPQGHAWQRNYFEHRLRPDEPANDYALYIFLNPYRKNLLGNEMVWPHWVRGLDVRFDFLQCLVDGKYPPASWLAADYDPRPVAIQNPVRASSAPTKTKTHPPELS